MYMHMNYIYIYVEKVFFLFLIHNNIARITSLLYIEGSLDGNVSFIITEKPTFIMMAVNHRMC